MSRVADDAAAATTAAAVHVSKQHLLEKLVLDG
jgi:hypothetical protein